MVSTLPGSVLGEMAFHPRGTQGVRCNIRRYSEVVPRKPNRLHSLAISVDHPLDVKQTNVLKWDRVA